MAEPGRGRLIIVTGPPGAGKTTVCQQLAEHGGFEQAVHLHTDDFFHAIRTGYVEPWRAGSERQNEIVVDATVAAAATYARGGYVVIVDGIVGPWFLDRYETAASRDQVTLDYVVLRPDEATTVARARDRPDHPLQVSGPVVTMHRAFADLGRYEAHVVDTTAQTAPETVAAVARAIADATHRITPHPISSSGGVNIHGVWRDDTSMGTSGRHRPARTDAELLAAADTDTAFRELDDRPADPRTPGAPDGRTRG